MCADYSRFGSSAPFYRLGPRSRETRLLPDTSYFEEADRQRPLGAWCTSTRSCGVGSGDYARSSPGGATSVPGVGQSWIVLPPDGWCLSVRVAGLVEPLDRLAVKAISRGVCPRRTDPNRRTSPTARASGRPPRSSAGPRRRPQRANRRRLRSGRRSPERHFPAGEGAPTALELRRRLGAQTKAAVTFGSSCTKLLGTTMYW